MSSPSWKFSPGRSMAGLRRDRGTQCRMLAAAHGHHGRGHRRDERLAAAARLQRTAVDDADRAPGLGDHALEAKARPARRREQVDLEFDGQHGGVGRHQRERRIAAGRVERGRRRCRRARSRAAGSGLADASSRARRARARRSSRRTPIVASRPGARRSRARARRASDRRGAVQVGWRPWR